jgi:hypothetical protein
MRAYHNDPTIKEEYLARVMAHRLADEIIKGTYWQDGKGCAVGCTIHSNNHNAYETELGIPTVLARLEDGIFESLPNERAKIWPEEFLRAINVGADLSGVWPKFAIWLLTDEIYGVLQYAKTEAQKKAIQDVAEAYKHPENLAPDDWLQLRNAADAAAYAHAAYAAAYAAAHAAAYAADAAAADAHAAYAYAAAADAAAAAYAADAAAAAAAYAADADAAAAAAADAAAAAAKQKARIAQADKLLELLREAI